MKCFLATVFLTLCASTANAAFIVYDVNRTIGAGTVTGSITTNGTIGVLSKDDIKDWSLTLTAPHMNGGVPDLIKLSETGGVTVLGGTAVTATAKQLLYDFDIPGTNHILFLGASKNFWCLETEACSDAPDLSEHIGHRLDRTTETFQLVRHTGTVAFANAAVIPVPAAVWLFGSGLLGLIGFAKHKR